jgi:hypothetical protein
MPVVNPIGPDLAEKELRSIRSRKLVHFDKRREVVRKFIEEHPGIYDKNLITEMRFLGIPRPDWIPEDAWNENCHHGPLDRMIEYMIVWGMSNKEISQALHVNACTAAQIRKTNTAAIDELRFRIFGESPRKWIESLLPKAIKTALEIMEDGSVKAQTRLAAAQDFMDRSMGKPSQKIEVEDNVMRAVLQALDKTTKTIELIKPEQLTDESDKQEVEAIQQAIAPKEEKDEVDKWTEEFQKSIASQPSGT